MEKDKHLGLHIDRELHYKLQYVSKYDGRSVSGEVLYLLRRYIADFEVEVSRGRSIRCLLRLQ